jgi:hypothetical protein
MAKKKAPTSRKGVQALVITAVARGCKDRPFTAKTIQKWLREIKRSRITDHLKSMVKKKQIVRKSRGIYANSK